MIRTGLIIVALVTGVSLAGNAQHDDKYQSISNMYVVEALKAANAAQAQELYEKALVANPSNVSAMIGLGDAHKEQGRVGRSLKYYRFALELAPNNRKALAAQALSFLKKENIDRAISNQLVLGRLCSEGCVELDTVSAAIEKFRSNPPKMKVLEPKS